MCERPRCPKLKNKEFNCVRANKAGIGILEACDARFKDVTFERPIENLTIANLNVTNSFIPPVFASNPDPLPPAGSVFYNSTTGTLNFSNGTSIQVLQTTAPQVDFISRTNPIVTPDATLELIDNSIPDDFPDSEDPLITLNIPDSPIGRTKTFVLLSIGTPDTSSDVYLEGNGISATLSPTGITAIQSATFVYTGLAAGWLNISSSTPVPAVASFGYPGGEELLNGKLRQAPGKEAIQRGYSVCMQPDGQWIAVGCPYAGEGSNTGQVIMMERNAAGGYDVKQTLIPDDAIGNSLFGFSIGTAENGVFAIGGPGDNNNLGAAWLYSFIGATWVKSTKQIPPASAGTGCQAGYSVTFALNVTTALGDPIEPARTSKFIIVGAPFTKETGGVFVYFAVNDSNVYQYIDTLFHRFPSKGSRFGYSVAAINRSFIDEYNKGERLPPDPTNYLVVYRKTGVYFFVGAPGYQGVWIMNAYYLSKAIYNSIEIHDRSYQSNEDGFIPAPAPTSLANQNNKLSLSPPPSVAGDTTANFGGIAFSTNRHVHTVYQLPTGIDVGPTFIYTSRTTTTVDDANAGTNPPLLLAQTNLAAYWPIPAQPRATISACPKIASDLTNNILYVSYTDSESTDSDAGAQRMSINVLKSTDGGAVWTPVTLPRPSNNRSAFLPNIAVDITTGSIAVAWLDCAQSLGNTRYSALARISNDQGSTWGPIITLSTSFSENSKHNNGYECGDYIGIDFHNNQFAVVWPDNSTTITPPNPNPSTDYELIIGFASIAVSGNNGTVTLVRNASGGNLGPHFSPSVAINRVNPLNIAVSASQATQDKQIYLATSIDGGNTWSGYNIFSGSSPPGLKKALSSSNMLSDISGNLYVSYMADDEASPMLTMSPTFGATANSFVLVNDFESTPSRIVNLPFICIGTLTIPPNPPIIPAPPPLILEYIGIVWQDTSQGYTFDYSALPPPPPGQWPIPTKCEVPSEGLSALSGSLSNLGITPPRLTSIAEFGASLACNANTLVIGAPSSTFDKDGKSVIVGVAMVYTGTKRNWDKFGPSLFGTDFQNSPLQGTSVAISGDGKTVLIGGPNDGIEQGVGACWLFTRSANNYLLQGPIRNQHVVGNARQGTAVALNSDGSVRVIGAPLDNNSAGSVFFYPINTPNPPDLLLKKKNPKSRRIKKH